MATESQQAAGATGIAVRAAIAWLAAALAGCAADAPLPAAAEAPAQAAPAASHRPDAPGVPPAPSTAADPASPGARLAEVALRNPGFELPPFDAKGRLHGWYFVQHAGPLSYEFALDDKVTAAGTQSMRIVNYGREPYGLVAQRLEIAPHQGRTLRFSGMVRTRGVTGVGAGLSIRVEQGSVLLSHDFMLDRLLKGDHDWRRVALDFTVDRAATHVELAIMLQGPGTVWFDDARLEVLP